ncbi:cadmium resistance transporter [Actinoplanes campanulatus]|uniref:cadmium resistance transporter n=1 Tax=Actinoplanes campanulatus TaxID=113559 RepID=UPI0019548BC4|nr:cadmium resistance transporter [Actinoplanes capillaceus]
MSSVLAAVGVFVGTNVDDLIVLTVLFLSARASGKPRPWQIWAGQYLGIATLVGVSLLAALGLTLVPDRWVGLLGLLPIALGVKGLIDALRDGSGGEPPIAAAGLLPIAGITIANGADNIAVYTPLFRTASAGEIVIYLVVFAILVALWCLAGSLLGSHRKVIAVVERWGHWLVPLVFIAIGSLILIEAYA